LLDVQHLLHLVPHRLVILEVKGGKGAYLDPAATLDFGDPFALILSYRGIIGERQEILARQAAFVAG
jgi:hypothetical protein